MTSSKVIDWCLPIATGLVAFVFIFSGIEKLLGQKELGQVLIFLGIPSSHVSTVKAALGAVELTIGMSVMVFGERSRLPESLLATLLLVYTGVLVYLASQSQAPSCGCIAALRALEQDGGPLLGIARNGLLLTPVITSLTLRRRR